MALDIGERHDDDNWDGRHRHIDQFAEGLAEVAVASCELNSMCINCSMYILGVKALARWHANDLARKVLRGTFDDPFSHEAQLHTAKQLSEMVSRIMSELINEAQPTLDEMRKDMKRNG